MPFAGVQAHLWSTGRHIHYFKKLSVFWDTIQKTNSPPIHYFSPHCSHSNQMFMLFNGQEAEKRFAPSVLLGMKKILDDKKIESPHLGKVHLLGGVQRFWICWWAVTQSQWF